MGLANITEWVVLAGLTEWGEAESRLLVALPPISRSQGLQRD